MNKDTEVPFSKQRMTEIVRSFPTPFHIYQEQQIRQTARQLNDTFSWAPGFKNYFAVKALPNPTIVDILRQEHNGADCSSLPELLIAERVGLREQQIMFTSNDTAAIEFKHARRLGAIINLDDITHIPFLEEHADIPDTICFRYNPGPLRKTGEGNVIGKPEEAKYGLTKDQLFEAYKIMKTKGVKHFGLHTMVASDERDFAAFHETAKMLFELAVELKKQLGIELEFVNMGGGFGIAYKPDQTSVDIKLVSEGMKTLYQNMIVSNGLHPLKIFMENGRFMTGPHGFLITTVIHEKHTYRDYIGVDACMADLMRPGMYDAYHHITVSGGEGAPVASRVKYDVVGSLCENNDKFAIGRLLPKINMGDILLIHNTGAHGRSMGFNYNGKLRSGEVLGLADDSVEWIRRKETFTDHFATFDFPGSKFTFGELLREHGLE